MKCQRCLSGEEASYRVRSDLIDMKVCAACADEARRLRLTVEVLGDEGRRGTGDQSRRTVASENIIAATDVAYVVS